MSVFLNDNLLLLLPLSMLMAAEGIPLLAVTGIVTIAIGFVILISGYNMAKTKNFSRHRSLMIWATIVLFAFLIQYITRAVILGQETPFEGPDTVRNFIYLPVLAVHVTFAMISQNKS